MKTNHVAEVLNFEQYKEMAERRWLILVSALEDIQNNTDCRYARQRAGQAFSDVANDAKKPARANP